MATPFQFNSQSFSKGIAGNVPFQQNNSLPDIATLNPKYTEFSNATSKRGVALKRHSISTPDILNSGDVAVKAFFSKTNAILYQNANEGKASRLKEYNTLGSMEAVKDALEEIANEFFNVDDKGRLARLNVKGKEDKPETLELLNKEFEKYFGYFQFDEYGPRYLKQFLKEGELFFEQIAHEDYMTQGVLGVEQMSAVLTEPLYINVVTEEMDGFILKRPIYDPQNPNIITGFELIPMSKGQVVYIHSDDWNVEHTFRVPHVDACRKAFRQLSMVEDCILIYRLVNAPERLVFNVDVGNMPAPKAEEYLAQMSQSYWSNRSYDPNKGDVVNQFNPQSTLDAFFFPIRTGSTGSKVEKLPAGQNLGELQDLQYFAQKLYKSLKVPTSRLQSDNTYRDGTDILREELKFANYIIDLQKQFARGIKLGFIAHLRLRGYLSKFDIKESDMTIKFNPPTNFFEMRESKRKEGNISNYQNITSDGYVSKTKAIMDEMKWSPEDVLANLEQRRRDAAIEWEIEQIRAAGPRWAELGGAAGAPGGAPPAPGGGGGGGGGMPPSFSGGPVDTEGGMGEADGAGEVPAAGANPVGQPELAETGSEDVDTGEPEVPQPV